MGKTYEDQVLRAKMLSVLIGALYFMAAMFCTMIIMHDGRVSTGAEEAIAFSLPIFLQYVWIFLPIAFMVGNAAKKKMIDVIREKNMRADVYSELV